MDSPETFKIFCGNLSPITTGNDLRIVFSKHGTVVEADVIIGKNFGFVHMASEREGMNALSLLQGALINGEKMVVQRAINSKKPGVNSNSISMNTRPTVGQGIGSLDDFEGFYEINENHAEFSPDLSNVLKQQSSALTSSSFNPLANVSNKSESGSERPSPMLHSSASSSSYTPEHAPYLPNVPTDEKIEQYERLLLSQDNKSMCGICNEEFNSHIHLPKILSCKHTFCLDCLTSLVKANEIKCPLGCPYLTILNKMGVSGLTTNQTKMIRQVDVGVGIAPVHNNQNNQNFEPLVCCICVCSPPTHICNLQKHQILRESDAAQLLKSQLHNLYEFSINTLRNVMTVQATLKERMQYTLHSLDKFAEELKLKIEGEELEQKMQHASLVEHHEMKDLVVKINSMSELMQKVLKMRSSYQHLTAKYSHFYAKDSINGALESILLDLKEPVADTCLLKALGLSRKEAFSLDSTLKENADKGNFANVLLIYLLSDLLFTRYRPSAHHQSVRHPPLTQSYNLQSAISTQQEKLEQTASNVCLATPHELIDINKMLETSKVIESTAVMNGTPSNTGADAEHYSPSNIRVERFTPTPASSERLSPNSGFDRFSPNNTGLDQFSPPEVSSALSFGLSNFSLLESTTKRTEDNVETKSVESDKVNATPRPVSYLDAVKKPAKPWDGESQSKHLQRSVPTPMKSAGKFPHCWMVISVNGINAGRIIFQLRPDKAPNMCDNFIGLCTGRSGYGYKGSHFFKSGDGYLVGGDVENDDGSGGYSVYDKKKFEADLCPLKDDVGMVRFKGFGTSDNGRGMVGSQFMIWFTERDFKKFSFSLVFGRVVDGLEIVQEAANHNLHKVAIKIEECGAI